MEKSIIFHLLVEIISSCRISRVIFSEMKRREKLSDVSLEPVLAFLFEKNESIILDPSKSIFPREWLSKANKNSSNIAFSTRPPVTCIEVMSKRTPAYDVNIAFLLFPFAPRRRNGVCKTLPSRIHNYQS